MANIDTGIGGGVSSGFIGGGIGSGCIGGGGGSRVVSKGASAARETVLSST